MIHSSVHICLGDLSAPTSRGRAHVILTPSKQQVWQRPQKILRLRLVDYSSRSTHLMLQPHRIQSLSDDEVTSTSGSNTSDHPEERDTGASVQLGMPRRSRQVTFTCNKCDGKTTRMVNPIAWDRGTVFVKCGTCEAWHNIRDAAGLIDEIRYNDSSDDAD